MIADRKHWCKYDWAKTKWHKPTKVISANADRFCAEGAIERAAFNLVGKEHVRKLTWAVIKDLRALGVGDPMAINESMTTRATPPFSPCSTSIWRPTMAKNLDYRIIKDARDLIADRDCWTQGDAARDAEGRPVITISPKAVSFCALGAIFRSAYNLTGKHAAANKLFQRLTQEPEFCMIVALNETRHKNTHERVLARFDAYLERVDSA